MKWWKEQNEEEKYINIWHLPWVFPYCAVRVYTKSTCHLITSWPLQRLWLCLSSEYPKKKAITLCPNSIFAWWQIAHTHTTFPIFAYHWMWHIESSKWTVGNAFAWFWEKHCKKIKIITQLSSCINSNVFTVRTYTHTLSHTYSPHTIVWLFVNETLPYRISLQDFGFTFRHHKFRFLLC